tara:strand:+ start:1483 stop:3498 length:2016 start_codon:yes stop_codon:yes gene_type:complete
LRYIGNKTKLLPFIEKCFLEHYGDLSGLTVCDLFAGTCAVASYFKPKVKTMVANDLEDYSKCLADSYVALDGPPVGYEDIIKSLNSVAPKTGTLSIAFTPEGPYNRMFFTTKNGRKIQAIREGIESYKASNPEMYSFLLCSLLESADSGSNTTGVYGAYLKQFSARTKQPFVLKPYLPSSGHGISLQEDASEIIKVLQGDILYLDPPYNNRQYGSNYHVLNCIVNHDSFEIKEVQKTVEGTKTRQESQTGLTTVMNRSIFSVKKKAKAAFQKLIESATGFDTIFMSYNEEGILSMAEVEQIFSQYGDYRSFVRVHKRYKSNNHGQQHKEVKEYIHMLVRKKKNKIEDILCKYPNRTFKRKKKVNAAPAPIVQWVGGKRQLINRYEEYFPKDIQDYYEPFMGGAAVFFKLQELGKINGQSYLSDMNKELVVTCNTIVHHHKAVATLLDKINEKHSKDLYYKIRNIDRVETSPKRYRKTADLFDILTDVEIAARFLYLNKTCFNALYRVNKNNLFNVPVGTSLKKDFSDGGRLKQSAALFAQISVTLEDYRSTISSAQKGDFVYLDPPYEPVDKKGSEKIKVGNKSFTSYTAEGFTSADQIALKEQCDKLDRRGIKFALSNSNAAMILELYKDYNVYQFEANRTLNSKKENRKNSAVEILVTNYKVAPTTDIE